VHFRDMMQKMHLELWIHWYFLYRTARFCLLLLYPNHKFTKGGIAFAKFSPIPPSANRKASASPKWEKSLRFFASALSRDLVFLVVKSMRCWRHQGERSLFRSVFCICERANPVDTRHRVLCLRNVHLKSALRQWPTRRNPHVRACKCCRPPGWKVSRFLNNAHNKRARGSRWIIYSSLGTYAVSCAGWT